MSDNSHPPLETEEKVNITSSDPPTISAQESADTKSLTTTEQTTNDDTEEPSSKRRRRTGWDVNDSKDIKVNTAYGQAAPAPATIPPAPILTTTGLPTTAAPKLSTPMAPPVPVPVITNTAGLTPQQIAQQILAAKPNLAGLVAPAKQECRIYVGSLHYDLREPDIIALFSSFGKVVKCDVGVEPGTGKSKGYCFLEFAEPHMAEAAMVMNGFDLAGRKIKVGRPSHANQPVAVPPVAGLAINPLAGLNPYALGINPTLGMRSQVGVTPIPYAAPPLPTPVVNVPAVAAAAVQTNFITVANIANEIGTEQIQDIFSLHGGIKNVKKLTAHRSDPSKFYDLLIEFHEATSADKAARIMNGHVLSGQRLDVQVTSLSKAIELMVQSVESSTLRCVFLENMITVEDTEDPGLKDEIAEEARKYGRLVDIDIIVDRRADIANMKLYYEEPADASRAHKALSGRLFAGRKIKATLVA